jgi:hypothetical protein
MLGYQLTDHRFNEDMGGTTNCCHKLQNDSQIKWLQQLERMKQDKFPKLLSDYKCKGRRDQGRL